jgi:preprotein translocase subunit SecG
MQHIAHPMSIIISLLTVVLVIVCLLIVAIVLMQRPRQEGLGAAFGGGMTDQMFGAQTTNVLQKGTVYLAVSFFGITLLLAILMAKEQGRTSAVPDALTESDPVPVQEAPSSGLTIDVPSLVPGEPGEGSGATMPAGGETEAPGAEKKPAAAKEGGEAEGKAKETVDAKADAKGADGEKKKKAPEPKPGPPPTPSIPVEVPAEDLGTKEAPSN